VTVTWRYIGLICIFLLVNICGLSVAQHCAVQKKLITETWLMKPLTCLHSFTLTRNYFLFHICATFCNINRFCCYTRLFVLIMLYIYFILFVWFKWFICIWFKYPMSNTEGLFSATSLHFSIVNHQSISHLFDSGTRPIETDKAAQTALPFCCLPIHTARSGTEITNLSH